MQRKGERARWRSMGKAGSAREGEVDVGLVSSIEQQ
jgi:hypothetical protein